MGGREVQRGIPAETPGNVNQYVTTLSVHAAVGKSIREGNRGGPDVRVYTGLKYEFGAPGRPR